MISTKVESKFRLGFLQDEELIIAGRDFIMNETNTLGQYISSNWFKEELVPNKTLYLFIIRYHHAYELIELAKTFCGSRHSTNIIGTFSIATDELVIKDKNKITHTLFENIYSYQKKTTMELSIVKDKNGRMFAYGPCITLFP